MSPELAGRFLTTGPPGKSNVRIFSVLSLKEFWTFSEKKVAKNHIRSTTQDRDPGERGNNRISQ